MPEIGQIISHYRILEKLGQGGMGEVFRAQDNHLHRHVAIKMLPDDFAKDKERLARFQREAELLSSLNHPNIAMLYGFEESEGNRFIVMELVEGETLAYHLRKGPLPVDEALQVCHQIAEGLEAAHEKGVIHRDLKPSNIMITVEDKVKILDFGLAKAAAAESAAGTESPTITETMTRAGTILGTAAYMSPEQAKGKPVDKRADIWSFGCILFECFTGRAPFQGETVTETVAKILEGTPEWKLVPPHTPERAKDLLRRCLQRNTRERLHDIGDARLDIEEARAGPLATDSIPSGSYFTWRQMMLMIVGVLVMGVAIAGLTVWYLKPSPGGAITRTAVTLPPGDRLATTDAPPIALSPDGRLLVYAANHGGTQQLFARAMDSQEPKPLPGTDGAECPFFSPDGQWIGFFAGGKIKKVSISGGTALTLCDSGSFVGAAWGNDDTIVFCPSANSGLLRVSAAGGVPRVLTTVDRAKGENGHRWPQFLPGGKALLFTAWSGPGWDESNIMVLRLDTGERRIVLRGGHTGRFVPTGHLIYYRAGSLLAVPFDLARLEVEGGAPVTIAEGVAQLGSPRLGIGAAYSFSAAGALAYVPADPQGLARQLVWMDRKGATEPLPAPPRSYRTPFLSPDGRQVALGIALSTQQIWIYNLTPGTLTRLTTGDGSSLYPVWTPDGKSVAYRGIRAGFRDIFWTTADGTGDEERLTTGENLQTPTSWSPDGKLLVYTDDSPTTGSDIWMLRLDGERKQQPLLQTQFNESGARFSRDGRWLAYQSNESGRSEIYVQLFPGPGGKMQISTEGGVEPRWANNGHELFYLSGRGLMVVDFRTEPSFSTQKPRLLFEGPFTGGYDVSQDDQRFLMVQAVEPQEPGTQITLVLNWFQELERLVPTGKK